MPTGCFDAIYERFAQADAWRVFADVRPFFELARRHGIAARGGFELGRAVAGIDGAARLLASFEVIIVSHEVGHHKPRPEIFLRAAHQLGLAPGEILHVGDSEWEDFDGARRAGLQAYWLRRTGSAGIRKHRFPGGDTPRVRLARVTHGQGALIPDGGIAPCVDSEDISSFNRLTGVQQTPDFYP
jgi:FMN phosphatase YigB (HAD superfamily)